MSPFVLLAPSDEENCPGEHAANTKENASTRAIIRVFLFDFIYTTLSVLIDMRVIIFRHIFNGSLSILTVKSMSRTGDNFQVCRRVNLPPFLNKKGEQYHPNRRELSEHLC